MQSHSGRGGGIPLRALAVIAALLLCLPLAGEELRFGRSLRRIETPSFDFYFPPELEAEARRLAGKAEELRDAILRDFLPDLPAAARARLPVLLTDEHQLANGGSGAYPSDRIILLAAPVEGDDILGGYDDDLERLFTHELTHALTLGIRPPLASFLAAVFGDPFSPARYAAPDSLVEGFAVAAESSGGHGRARDPLGAEPIRQALIQGQGLSFWQAAGAWDRYPFGNLSYLYGGRFASWLRERFGAEAFSGFWRDFGSFRGIEDGLILRGAFRRAFGLGLDEAWTAFLDAEEKGHAVLTTFRPLLPTPGYISALTADRRTLYWAEAGAGAVLALDRAEGSKRSPPRRLFPADALTNRLSLSPDGKRLLVSTTRQEAGRFRLFVREWELEGKRWVGEEVPDLREASYAGPPDEAGNYPLLGIRVEGARGDLVLRQGGTETLLASGSTRRGFSSPVALEGAFYAIVRDEGRRLLLKIEGSGAWVLAPERPLEYLRYLSAGPGALAFGCAAPDGLYRLGLLEEPGSEAPRLRLQETELSGGVHLPALVSGPGETPELYYQARRTEGEYLAAYPFEVPGAALREARATWVRLDSSFLADAEEAPMAGPESSRAPAFPLLGRTFRVPTLSEELDAAGLRLIAEDLAGRLGWELGAAYSWGAQAANLDAALTLNAAPWAFRLAVEDRFRTDGGDYHRESSASLEIGAASSLGISRQRLELGLHLEAGALGPAPSGDPYGAGYERIAGAGRLSLAYSDLHSTFAPPFPLSGGVARVLLDAESRLDANPTPALSLGLSLAAHLPGPRLSLELAGAWSPDGRLRFRPGSRRLWEGGAGADSLLAPSYPRYREYQGLSLQGSLYGYGSASALFVAAELQERVWKTPIYLRRLGLSGGLRAAAMGGEGAGAEFLSSAFGQLSLEATPLYGMFAQFGFIGGVELAYRLPEAYAGDPWSLGILFGARL